MDTEQRQQIRLSDQPASLDALIDEWLRYGDRRTHVKIREYGVGEGGEHSMRYLIYTDNNSYSISARFGGPGKTYLGCIASSRKPRAGEDWTRGNDLSDGPFTYETWFSILADIVSYELVKIAKPQRPVGDGVAFPSGAGYDLPRRTNQETADVEGRQPGPQPFPPAPCGGQTAHAPTPSYGAGGQGNGAE